MKLEEINKIKQTYDAREVNELLARGYRIIKIFSTKQKTEDSDEVKPCYILGLQIEEQKT